MSLFCSNPVFESATRNFVDNISSKTASSLQPSQDLHGARKCIPFNIMVMREKGYFSNRIELQPTSFKLWEILDSENPVKPEDCAEIGPENADFVSFEGSLAYKLSGE